MWAARLARFLGFGWLVMAFAVSPCCGQLREGLDAIFKSGLRRAIDRGMRVDGDLAQELEDLGDYSVATQRDATAICELLKRLPLPADQRTTKASESAEYYVVQLFRTVEDADCDAVPILREQGIPELIRLYERLGAMNTEAARDDQLTMLSVFAMYSTASGTEKVIEAVRAPLQPDDFMWYRILGRYDSEHPQLEKLYAALSDPLPVATIDAALLDAANSLLLEGASIRHPFDSPAGRQRLRDWLAKQEVEDTGPAFDAAVAVAFLSGPERDDLLTLAMNHPDSEVRMEAAWAAARLGQERGLQALVEFCLDLHCSERATRYLAELNREDRVPPESRDPEFAARAEFAAWLAHPNELARQPDEVTIVDQREFVWPPDGQRRRLYLMKFLARRTNELDDDDAGVGLVGSMTFCFFDDAMLSLPPEDVYAAHCSWEAENADLLTRIAEPSDKEKQAWLSQWQDQPLTNVHAERGYRIAPELKYPRATIAAAEATLEGEAGFAVLDGPQSRWYRQSDFPPRMTSTRVLEIHLGRQLLGLEDTPDRRKFFLQPPAPRDPVQIVAAYDKLLGEAEAGDLGRRTKLLAEFASPLESHFKKYIAAVAVVGGKSETEAAIAAGDRLFASLQALPDQVRGDAFEHFAGYSLIFDVYIDALVSAGQTQRVADIIAACEPFNTEGVLDGDLGAAAFRAGQNETAERLLRAYLTGIPTAYLLREQSMLAESLHRLGRVTEARAELLTSLKGCQEAYTTTDEQDADICEESYQDHRATFLRLFASDGLDTLNQEGLPTTLRANKK
jgi:hypothetical protein